MSLVSWELFNLSLYLLVSLSYGGSESTLSAALKYFLLSAFSTGMLLLGVLILYGSSGCMHYDSVSLMQYYDNSVWIDVAYVLILGCLLFKVSAAPLHNWSPDLYDALPTSLTLWMAVVPKVAVLGFLGILSCQDSSFLDLTSASVLAVAGVTSLIVGSLGMGSQLRIKRLLAYSGISHVGFMILALYCHDLVAYFSYIFVYAVTTVNVFVILIALARYHRAEIIFVHQLSSSFVLNPY